MAETQLHPLLFTLLSWMNLMLLHALEVEKEEKAIKVMLALPVIVW
jgi:hypothetical protein